jgi:Toprim domain-containing protein
VALSWIDEVRARGVAAVALALGLAVEKRAISPCPACHASTRHPSRGDRRGAVGVTSDGRGWRCHECGVGGDAVDLAAFALLERIPYPRETDAWLKIRDALEGVRSGEIKLPPTLPEPPRRPPQDEVRALWNATRSVTDDPPAARWLTSRGIAPELVAERDLARAIAPDATLPAWACFGRKTWNESAHRLLLRLHDAEGKITSLHARFVGDSKRFKSVSPTGYSTAGLVMACSVARRMLAGWPAACEQVLRRGLVVVEGVPDFLTLATHRDAATAPAVFGVTSGSWTPEHARWIPSGAVVVVAPHADEAGDRLAQKIAATLEARGIRWTRWRKENGA